ncbi:hypothetical protein F5148DRAFT_1207825 [Russula earlei]|uniref:Uncharacterized protein n=1 Tax=Russula earlei TaxID=71964 RepID=A0ACC0U649_9AGAM|nr:hypothetical protein F5148DRAFT_1207825 [Russula earlei]
MSFIGFSRADNLETSDYAPTVFGPYDSPKYSTVRPDRVWGSCTCFSARRFLRPILSRTTVSTECDAGLSTWDDTSVDYDTLLPNGPCQKRFRKHLDGILRARCRCGLDPTNGQESTSSGLHRRAAASRPDFEAIMDQLVALDDAVGSPESHVKHTVHELRLTISGYRWMASSVVGTFRSEARDMEAEDIATFALLDTLTRWLSHWRGGILRVHTNDGCIAWGILGTQVGLWPMVHTLCAQFGVQLRANLVEQSEFFGRPRDEYGERSPPSRALRNPDVVNVAVKWLTASGRRGHGDATFGRISCVYCPLSY